MRGHSFTFQLNVSDFCGIGGPLRVIKAVFEGYQGVLGGVLGVFLCQKGLRLS